MKPTINSTIETVINSKLKQVWTSEPGVVESFDPATRTSSVRLASKILNPNGSTSTPPVIPDVPVFINGGGGGEITFPVKAGDPCIILWASHEIDQWTVGKDVPVDPRNHAFHDCFCIPGMHSPANAPSEYATDRIELGFQSGKRLSMTQSTVHLGVESGGTATESAVLGNAQKQAFDSFVNTLMSEISILMATGACAVGPVQFAGLSAFNANMWIAKDTYDQAPFLSTKVKVK